MQAKPRSLDAWCRGMVPDAGVTNQRRSYQGKEPGSAGEAPLPLPARTLPDGVPTRDAPQCPRRIERVERTPTVGPRTPRVNGPPGPVRGGRTLSVFDRGVPRGLTRRQFTHGASRDRYCPGRRLSHDDTYEDVRGRPCRSEDSLAAAGQPATRARCASCYGLAGASLPMSRCMRQTPSASFRHSTT
jgi:hypothetical protein